LRRRGLFLCLDYAGLLAGFYDFKLNREAADCVHASCDRSDKAAQFSCAATIIAFDISIDKSLAQRKLSRE